MKALVVFGTRPEAIKMAPLIWSLAEKEGARAIVVNTGQHMELIEDVLHLLRIPIHHHLNVMKPDQSLSNLLSVVVRAMDRVIAATDPDIVFVQGDTASALGASLAAFHRQVPIGHVEAGLRSGDRYSPFPEEMNRRLISAISTWHFAPSPFARDNLVREGHDPASIVVVGNTVVDALLRITKDNSLSPLVPNSRKIILATIHRRENHPHLNEIFGALASLAETFRVVLPLHPNPTVQRAAADYLQQSQVEVLPPFGYSELLRLMMSADVVVTDSGGIQEEAPVIGTPLLIVRKETERPEIVQGGYGYLGGTDKDTIIAMAHKLIDGTLPCRKGSPYGDGTAATQIVSFLSERLPLNV